MKKFAIAGVACLALLGVALAQTVIPLLPTIGTTDYIQDIPNGNPGVGNRYVTPQQIAGVPGYVNEGAAVTAFSYTFGNSTTDIFMQPAGTLATGTLTTAPNPSDGQRECFLSTQTQTALTWSANTGQSISGAPTAGVANTPYCMTYNLAAATWYRSP
jgi:hypothetical protein